MHKHRITIVFAADEHVGFDALIDSFGNQVQAAGGRGVEIDHTRQWVDNDITAVAYIEAEPHRSGDPDYSRNHVQ